jgi:RimJ/RimL family protein N-acetyltransferase
LPPDNEISIQIKSPGACSPKELRDFKYFVSAGGEASTNRFDSRIQNCLKLFFAGKEKTIGVCGIKRPDPNYINNVFGKAGISCPGEKINFEFGWLYVSPSFRKTGVGGSLIRAALAIVGEGCFATTRATNITMHALLLRNGFMQQGNNYKSGNGEYFLSLFTNAW